VGTGSLLARTPTRGLMLLLPVAVTLAAAALNQYPLTYRTTLFLLPMVVLTLVEGIARMSAWAPVRWAPFVAVGLGVAVAAGPAWQAATAAAHPPGREEIKPVLTYVRDHWRRGDTLYLHYGAQHAFLYYDECGCFSATGPRDARLWRIAARPDGRMLFSPVLRPTSRAVLVGPSQGTAMQQINDLDRLQGRTRVWFLYSHVSSASEPDFIRRRLLGRLNQMGRRTAEVSEPGAHAYLYTLFPARSG
jgi:hypothetical protein